MAYIQSIRRCLMKKFFNISNYIVKIFFALFITLYSISNILFSVHINNLVSNSVTYNFGIDIVSIIYLIIAVLFLVLLIKKNFFKISENKLLIIFLAICLITGLFWIFTNDIELRELDDAYNSFRIAKSINKGDYGVLSYRTYISVYPNNIGLVTYDLINIKIFGETGALYSIRLINLIFVLVGYYCLYEITKLLFNNNRLINCVLIYLMFGSMQFVFYSFFVYGNCLSYSFALLSVLFLLKFFKDNKVYQLLISAISIILSISIKMNSIIVLIAESIYVFLYILKNKRFITILFIVLSFTGMYLGTSGLQKFWGSKVDIDYNDTKLPTICWLAYGLNYDETNPGHYFNEFEVYHYDNGFNGEFTSNQAKIFINGVLNRFKEKPSLALKFYFEKFLVSWTNPQYEAFDQYRELNNSELSENIIAGDINDFLDNYWDAISTIISIGLAVYIVKRYRKVKLFELIGAVVVIGGFLFHSFWEVKAIYLYQYFMYLLPYAACGISLLFNDDVIIDTHENEII